MDFDKKAVIVTGATSGIGLAAAHRFMEEGASLLAVGRDRDALDELTGGIDRAVACQADLTEAGAPAAIVAQAVESLGGIDVLVNAAGIIETGPLEETSDEAWERTMEINLRAPFSLMREALPHLKERKGAVVNVSSVAGPRVFPGILSYCVSKAGLDQLTRCAAIELAPQGVRVNAVNPGVVVTNLHRRAGMDEEQYAAFLEHSKETHPMGRPGTADEVADLILYLSSDKAGWITGEAMVIDGGRHLTCAR